MFFRIMNCSIHTNQGIPVTLNPAVPLEEEQNCTFPQSPAISVTSGIQINKTLM